jgi:hypothetical protein
VLEGHGGIDRIRTREGFHPYLVSNETAHHSHLFHAMFVGDDRTHRKVFQTATVPLEGPQPHWPSDMD